MVRCFVNIEISEEQRKRISELVKELKKIDADVKWVQVKNTHITPRFLGEISENDLPKVEEGLKKIASESSAFDLKLKGTGVFPNRDYVKVIWIGIEDCPELNEIKKRADEYISVGKKDSRPFSPHVTIGRVKGKKGVDEILKKLDEFEDTEFGTIEIESINVKKSTLLAEGPVYEILFEEKLG